MGKRPNTVRKYKDEFNYDLDVVVYKEGKYYVS